MTDLQTVKKLHLDNKILLLDIREEDEWNLGHIVGAVNVPLSKLTDVNAVHLVPNDRPVYLYCASGRRTVVAEQLLRPFIDFVFVAGSGSFDELKTHGFASES